MVVRMLIILCAAYLSAAAVSPTKYPVMLVHGVSTRDDKDKGAYWGRIPERIRQEGVRVFFSGQDAWRPHESNAMLLAWSIRSALEASGAAKINLIAMSKGGIESRYAVTHLGMAPFVASLTTIATPHRGSAAADYALEQYAAFGPAAQITFSIAGVFSGDGNPDVHGAAVALSRAYMAEFNRTCPDSPLVYYQSYAFVMKRSECNFLLAFQHAIMYAREGTNDGLVSTVSARWGNFRGIIEGDANGSGVSHFHAHDGYRQNVSGFDTPAFYVSIVRDLAARGF